jgi:hypothetical protein
VLLMLTRMRRLLAIDTVARLATVGMEPNAQ